MAHIPKREPCVKCNNPVFFAERLVINASLYHRTCFKCARCSSVLTLGSYYETENDHEYCCETCPDEEKVNKAKVDESNRLSIAQRIALFEKETSSVLKKSLSDEEKSKSLNRQAPVNSGALNSFLTTQIDGAAASDCEEDKTIDSISSESESEDEQQPSDDFIPSISDKSVAISDHKVNSKPPDNIVVTKELTKVEAIADSAATNSESQLDIASVVVVDKSVPEASPFHDDIELEFERLAEEALAPTAVAKEPAPIIVTQKSKQEVKVEESAKDKEVKEVEEPTKVVEVEEPTKEVEENKRETTDELTNKNEKQESIVEQPVAPVSVVVEAATPTIEETVAFSDGQTLASKASPEPKESEIDQTKVNGTDYPDDLNPFGDEEPTSESSEIESKDPKRPSLNPFGSCSEDEEEENVTRKSYGTLPKPPRPPPPKTMTLKAVSTNPFGSDDEDEEPTKPLRTPVPTPRKPFITSATPEPTPRSLSSQNSPGHSFKGSTSSLSSSTDGMSLRRKKKPAPPPPVLKVEDVSEAVKTPSTTPRKKRPAPTPPTSTPKPTQEPAQSLYITASDFPSDDPQSTLETSASLGTFDDSMETSAPIRRLIPLEECLIEEGTTPQATSEETVTYRRKIVPLSPQSTKDETLDNLETSKDNKEAENRQRQSQGSLVSMRAGSESTDSLPYLNKSSHGKWKRRKGPAPALPGYLTNSQPQRRILQMLPMQEIRQELEVIEVQQQGLEKQGVMLEKMIRERCEGSGDNRTTEELLEQLPSTKNPKGVEELILQLFELVNEKNELFRRQAELMYLRRAHRLEEEQADVEYEIRTLMAQPEQNKTDSDKTKEEALIARLVEIVQLRNEVVDCLDRDRLREAEEDLSIKQRMESHTAKLDQDYLNQTPTKLSKKEKKKLKEAKKLKNKKLDADKDLDTSEMKSETTEKKKKKKKFLF